jgi:prophage regulatory protein
MSDSLLRLAEVSRRVGLKKTALYAAIDRGDFPAPVKIGPSSRWVEAEVQAWIDQLKAARDGDGNGDRRLVA